jgi:LacI family transcriptional regulator
MRQEVHLKDGAATIRDIARTLGVSIGTVDRALHNRPEVNATTRERVLQTATKLGYRANQAARYLSTGRKLNIWVSLPREIAAFFEPIRTGIENEAAALAPAGVKIIFRRFPRLGVGEEEVFQAALDGGANGIIVVPGHPKTLKPFIRKASRAQIPVVCVATDAPDTNRLGVVSIDPEASGALAAELMGRFVSQRGEIALVTGDLSTEDHAQKLAAYSRVSHLLFPEIRLLPPIEAHDNDAEAYEKMRDLLRRHKAITGVYVSTINSPPVLRALKDCGALGKIHVITTDLFPELVPYLKSSDVTATIYQRPSTQGQVALRMIHRYLVGDETSSQVRLAPHLVMRGNLPFFLSQALHADGQSNRVKNLEKLL